MAVPLFLMIQSYHFFKSEKDRQTQGLIKRSYGDYMNLKKIWNRIIRPFVVITLLTGAVLVLIGHDPLEVVKSAVFAGGIGPGSYYVWIYLQFFLLLPLCLTFINKWKGYSLILFVLISQSLEWLCMFIQIPEHIYRLTCFRYVFLIYLGYLWVSNRMSRSLTTSQIIISFVSLSVLLFLYYTTGSLKPFLHDTAWRSFHWICYFYAALLLPWVIWKFYDHLPQRIRIFIGEIGKCSYEIFLIQMVVFKLYPHSLLSVGKPEIDRFLFIIISIALSILPVIIWSRAHMKNKLDVKRS